MKTRRTRRLSSAAAVAAVAIAWTVGGPARAEQAAGAAGQGPPPPRVSVTTTQLKPEMAATWRDLIRTEGIPAFKKAGIPWRWVFATGPLGGQGFTYVTVTPIAKYAHFDEPSPIQRALGEGAAKYQAKLQPTIVSTHTIVQTLIQNASIQSVSSTPAPLVRVTTMQLLPGKGQEFAAITASEFLPAFKKVGVTDYLVFATSFGGSTLQRTIVTPVSKYAELDAGGGGPLARALGQEAALKINQRRGALTSDTQVTILRYIPELSYGVPAPPKTSSQ